jgi:hypothetical protein
MTVRLATAAVALAAATAFAFGAAGALAQPAPPAWNPAPSITASLNIGGSGNFTGVIETKRLCYMINAPGIQNPTGAVIQSGRKNNAGTVVLTLKPPVGGASADCVPISDELAGKLVKDADKYWFTIQSAQYPDGAAGAWLQGMNG